MIKQSGSTTRPLVWEDDAPAEPRIRRVQQPVPPQGRALPGMPLEMADPDDDSPRMNGERSGGQRRSHQDRPSNPRWRPASTIGRVFLTLAVLVVLSGLVASAHLLKTYLGRDGRFRISGASNIDATGLTEVSRAEMLPVFGEDIGRNIFFVPLNERRKQLEKLPWIEKATVMRLLPDQIRVSVVERQPVAFTRQGQLIGLVDANGVLLTMPAAMMAQHNYSFPVVTGIDAHDAPAARKARMAVYQRLLAELDANGQHISEQISEIDLTVPEDARVLMPEQGTDILAHFGEDRFMERYQRYKAHIAQWRQQYPKLAAVDLRYDQQVVLEMASGANVAEAAAEEQNASNANADASPASSETSAARAAADPTPSKAQLMSVPAKTIAKPAAHLASKPPNAREKIASVRALTAKDKAAKLAREKKKRTQAKRAAMNASKHKTPPTARPAPSAGEGQ